MKLGEHTVQGVIFDVDGTLLDTVEMWITIASSYIRSLQLVPEAGLDQMMFSMSMEEGARYLSEHYFPEKAPGEIVKEVNDMLQKYYRETARMRNGAKEILEWLSDRGVFVAAATATDRPLVESAFERLGIREFFKDIFTCSQVGASKKNPRIYEQAAACLGTTPEVTLVVEDAWFAIKTAGKAGFVTAGIYERHSAPEQHLIRQHTDFYGQNLYALLNQWKVLAG